MANILVRNLDDSIKSQLAMHARRNGHSMEEEVRQILQKAMAQKGRGLGSRIAERFKEIGLDREIPEFKGQSVINPFEAS